MMTQRSNTRSQAPRHRRISCNRGMLAILISLISICTCSRAQAWTGEVQGVITLDQQEVIVSGSGKWLDRRDLSFLGSAYLPSGRRVIIKMELEEAEESREMALDQPGYIVNYLEFSPRGATVMNAQVTSGWVQVQEPFLGVLEIKLAASIDVAGQTRTLEAQTLRLIDPDVDLPSEVIDDPEFAVVLLADDGYQDDDYQDDGCYFDDDEEYYEDDDYQDDGCYFDDDEEYYEDESGCDSDSGAGGGGGGFEVYDEYDEGDYQYGESESEADEDGCADDDFAAEASTHQRRRTKRRRPPLGWRLFLRLLPLLGSTLLVLAWRRRLRS